MDLFIECMLWVHTTPAEVEYVVQAIFAPCPRSWAIQDLCPSDKRNSVGSEPTRWTIVSSCWKHNTVLHKPRWVWIEMSPCYFTHLSKSYQSYQLYLFWYQFGVSSSRSDNLCFTAPSRNANFKQFSWLTIKKTLQNKSVLLVRSSFNKLLH